MHSNFLKVLAGWFLLAAPLAEAKLRVYTTTTNSKALVAAIAGERAEVTSFTKGSQDPHFLDAKPSFMVKLSRADLLVSIGLGLEVGWLPAALGGARNADLMPGGKGSLVLGDHVEALDQVHGQVSREHGDIHPEGNPHFMLSPSWAYRLADVVAAKLSELDHEGTDFYIQQAEAFKNDLATAQVEWKRRMTAAGQVPLITYHKSLRYFLNEYAMKAAGFIEPKPGIPPTPSHIVGLIKFAKEKKIQLALVENYFPVEPAQRIAKSVPGMRVQQVPVAVGAVSGVDDLMALYETLVSAIAGPKDPA